ncbi:MAG: MotA/TolQ/ExbB proton channel family protein [Bdellovibrionales bacterium]|nr:MotA/TolQ/ExbB proton channel family protein [Bdellovibrionales bacterium]
MKLNIPMIAAYVGVGGFVYGIVTKLTSNPSIFVNREALVVICGGMVLAAFVSFPWLALRQCFHAIKKIMTDPPKVPVQEAREIVRLSSLAQRSVQSLDDELEKIEHPFLKEAVSLILDGLPRAFIHETLEKRISERREALAQDANVVMTLSKYSPALGLAATVLGLVDLLGKLGTADMTELGLGMATALSATFYGITIANLVFAPLSELLISSGETDHKTRELILDGVMALLDRKHPLVTAETVNSHLPIRDRIDFSADPQVGNYGGDAVSRMAA